MINTIKNFDMGKKTVIVVVIILIVFYIVYKVFFANATGAVIDIEISSELVAGLVIRELIKIRSGRFRERL